jgi:benzoylformate decarboxylase
VAPSAEAVARAADLLRGAARPLIVMGDGIAFSGAQAELTRIAELLGAPVWGANSSEVNIDALHPLFRGQLGHMFGEHSKAITSEADAVLICGTYVFPEVFPALEGVFAPGAKVVHVELDAYEIAKNFPDDLVVFDEALTASPALTHYLPPTRPGHYFATRGGSLGVGFPGAMGVKLALPEKTVIGFSGDGGAMYTIQAMWTAARHDIGAKFVVCNNRSYQLLKLNVQQYWRERDLDERDFPGSFDLDHPELRFDELARSMGVSSARVESADEVAPAITEALAEDGPFLIDLVLHQEVPGHAEDAANRRPVAGTRAHS